MYSSPNVCLSLGFLLMIETLLVLCALAPIFQNTLGIGKSGQYIYVSVVSSEVDGVTLLDGNQSTFWARVRFHAYCCTSVDLTEITELSQSMLLK